MLRIPRSLARRAPSPFLRGTLGGRAYIHVEKRLEELGYTLPVPPKSQANYVQCNQVDNIVYVAGHLPVPAGGELMRGIVGKDYDLKEAQYAAKLVALNFISTLKHNLGDLDKVKKIVKVVGFVASTDDFTEHHLVINGFSDTMGEVFGKKGRHARSAVGL
ncbi:hypothetical protein AAMO2058_000278900 [Amorphochlora amoebiformis]|uniref:Endoribonuclease L-PSP/chorismate mutase-like domain-containing protein n=1 Tax=Amorphochlora amoebiformis TaxID=1561963 RepID=A0A7S0GVN5_9EUKA|mmetsp:Transcript_17096/g.27170  ORF Transcript_17096/g.27170 Transcript_17096/m.27170 type:complete len:161 (+) Transcript_17096:47-529(+)